MQDKFAPTNLAVLLILQNMQVIILETVYLCIILFQYDQ